MRCAVWFLVVGRTEAAEGRTGVSGGRAAGGSYSSKGTNAAVAHRLRLCNLYCCLRLIENAVLLLGEVANALRDALNSFGCRSFSHKHHADWCCVSVDWSSRSSSSSSRAHFPLGLVVAPMAMIFSRSSAGSPFHPSSPTPTDEEGSPSSSPPFPRRPTFPSSGKRGPPAPTRCRMPAKVGDNPPSHRSARFLHFFFYCSFFFLPPRRNISSIL